MEPKNTKFRFHLNLFDGIVILAALLVAAFLLWNRLKPTATVAAPTASKVQYTICLKKVLEGTGELVKAGDALEDTVKNYELGQVVSAQTVPATKSVVDEGAQAYVTSEIPGYEDILIQVESSATITDEKVAVGGGYALRVGEAIYVRGPGYMGSGEVYAIERGQ